MKQIIEEEIERMRESWCVRTICEGVYQIQLPFLDPSGDAIVTYVEKEEGDRILVHDSGYAEWYVRTSHDWTIEESIDRLLRSRAASEYLCYGVRVSETGRFEALPRNENWIAFEALMLGHAMLLWMGNEVRR